MTTQPIIEVHGLSAGYDGRTVLHDIDMALRYSDEICVMREGRLLAQGTPCDHDVLDGIEAAFDVRIEHLHGKLGSAYALFNLA